ncbi:uncharacterized protein BO96DRAFT_43489 [Aspergillus niger CBS 101883]|uniref:uncharacterized protein n=1 Tax=Aspergillus lacticoffeatus (strain CBS 101883) TaxID=1450533 RepID=UPI000D7FAE97|nr:uncharacterized protein BO96DRAFT_43489 [Aspergillus niger CBS 101883]PYH56956.1 hypothetical protein BO96DRAFT_43489 [Aspergillus niger CBS 101883]
MCSCCIEMESQTFCWSVHYGVAIQYTIKCTIMHFSWAEVRHSSSDYTCISVHSSVVPTVYHYRCFQEK